MVRLTRLKRVGGKKKAPYAFFISNRLLYENAQPCTAPYIEKKIYTYIFFFRLYRGVVIWQRATCNDLLDIFTNSNFLPCFIAKKVVPLQRK